MALRLWRWIIVLLLIGYSIISLGIPVRALLFNIRGGVEEVSAPMMDLIASMQWIQIIAWLTALLFYLLAALCLGMARRRAMTFAVAGAVLDIGQWASLKYGGDAYNIAFSSGQQAFDYSLFGFLAIIVGSIWVMVRRGALR